MDQYSQRLQQNIDMHPSAARLYEAAERLRGARRQVEVARLLNISPQRLGMWEVRGVSREGMLDAQKVIGVNATWLETGSGQMEHMNLANTPNLAAFLAQHGIKKALASAQDAQNLEITQPKNFLSVPLISWVKAGAFEAIEDCFRPGEADDWIVVYDRKVSAQTFALKVVGDSMSRDKDPSFDEGDILICDPNMEAKPGDFVIAKNTAEQTATFKRLTSDGVQYYLMPLNPMYQPIVMNNGDFRVIARVVQRIKVSSF